MYKNKKIILFAFASLDLKKSLIRMNLQAKNSKFYDEIKIFTPKNFDEDIKMKVEELISKGKKRGYGYWIWKPYFISKILDEIDNEDIIHYVDIGCHLIDKNFKRFYEYLEIISDKDKWLLPFQYHINKKNFPKKIFFPEREEYKFTKADLLNYFDYLNDKEIIDSPQYWAGSFFIKKNDFSIKFVNEWLNIFYERFDLVDDTPSKIKNYDGFVENRHDQSVYSLLCKKYKLTSLSAYECDWAISENKRTWQHNKYNPILAKRDLEYNIFKRFFNRQKKTYKRILKKFFKN